MTSVFMIIIYLPPAKFLKNYEYWNNQKEKLTFRIFQTTEFSVSLNIGDLDCTIIPVWSHSN